MKNRVNPAVFHLLLVYYQSEKTMNTSLTKFFRNSAQLKAFEYYVIPHVLSRKARYGATSIRIWSAGCSTGEEPYTVGILCREILPPKYTFEICACDVDKKVLEKAMEGFFPAYQVSPIPARYLNTYFRRESGGYRIHLSIRDTIRFFQHDLTAGTGPAQQDVVFLRNVSMYYDHDDRKTLFKAVWESMSRGAYLFIGDSESLFALDTGFEFVHTGCSAVYTKP